MKSVPVHVTFAALLLMITILGCTRHSSTDSQLISDMTEAGMATYFPTAAGWTTAFNVTSNGNISTLTCRVADDLSISGQTAHRWILTPSQGTPDTNYVVVQPRALLVYQDPFSTPEHLLQLPLSTGASWLRFPELSVDQNDTTSILTDITGGKLDTLSDPGNTMKKLLPFQGENELTVAGREDLTLSTNLKFAHTVKITNSDRYGHTNSYWFAAGVGLVKFVVGQSDTYPSGTTSGELYDYGE